MDAQQLRSQLARWASGVTVITTIDRTGEPLGKVANSFHAVSLAPPLVAWCVDRASTRFDEWLAADSYAVHVLGDHQTDLVRRFAAKGGDKFTGLSWTPGPGGVPLIDRAHLRVVARVTDRHPAGDHTYLIGEIISIDAGESTNPLIFHGGKVSSLVQSRLTNEGR